LFAGPDTERRRWPRSKVAIDFYCYLDGHRFDSVSVDVSSGGLLLNTPESLRKDAIVMLVPKENAIREYPVVLVGRVVRRHEGEKKGLALEWLRCITRQGVNSILSFLAAVPEFCQLTLPSPTAEALYSSVLGYDFKTNRFYVPALPGLNAPLGKAQAEPVGAADSGGRAAARGKSAEKPRPAIVSAARGAESLGRRMSRADLAATRPVGKKPTAGASKGIVTPPPFGKSEEEGAVTQRLRVLHEEIPVELPVEFMTNELEFKGFVRMLSLSTLFVACASPLDQVGTKAEVKLSIPLHGQEATATLACSVSSIGTDPRLGQDGIAMAINSVVEESEGIFDRYVKYPYYRMLTQ
jgi:hypothetical protein